AEQVQVNDAVAAAVVEDVAGDVVHMATPSPPPHGIPSPPPQEQSSPPYQPPYPPQPQDAVGLENDKAAQQLEIVKLKARVEKLEKINKVKSSKLRRLKKVGTSQRVESSDDMENVFNQGRIIVDMDQDEGIELITDQEKDAKFKGRHADKQLREEMEAEDAEIIKSINETPAQKAAKRRKLSEKAQEAEDLRKRLEIVQDKDDDVFIEATPLAQKVPVLEYHIVVIDNKPRYKIKRADDTHQLYINFTTLLKNFDREDLEALWKIVRDRGKE
nr:hypothetical protein [Tanacetum cinerariifolium]